MSPPPGCAASAALYIMFAELLPNVMPPVMVEFTVRLGYAIFTAATLSFLNFGIQLPTPDWGLDISQNFSEITAGYWWEMLFPAAADRDPGDRDQPGRGRRRGRARPVSAEAVPAPDALAVRDLDVAYRVRGQDREAVRGVSFRIGRGESYGLVGESGCGKSTIALALVATCRATAG